MSRTTDYYYPYLSKEDARTDSMLKGGRALGRIADALERIADTLERQRLTMEGTINNTHLV
jgi:hypothetical protein